MDIKTKTVKAEEPVNAERPEISKRVRRSAFLTKFRVITSLAVLLVLTCGFLTFKYIQVNNQVQQLKKNPQNVVSNSTQRLLGKVGDLAELPQQTQAPSIAIVKNVDQLKSQAFFNSAQDGDYLIVYAQAKKAILYRPSDNKIIEYGNTN